MYMAGRGYTKINSRIKTTISTEEVQGGLPVVTLAGLVNLGLCQNNQSCTQLIPLQLDLVTLKKGLLRNGAGELRNEKNLDSSWLALNHTY